MPNYQLGKIYKIIDYTNNNIYIGSTSEPTLARRLASHKRSYKQWKDGKCNKCMSYDIFENDNYDIILLENCPCNTKDELHAREKFYIQNNECINKYVPLRTKKEYYNDNAETIKNKVKQYAGNNKEQIQQYKKEYREKNREMLSEKNKEYRNANKEHLKEVRKLYNEKNREQINKYKREWKQRKKLIISELQSEGETPII
jgi:hypothetical protein